MDILIKYYGLKKLNLFILIVLSNILLIWLFKNVLVSETIFYNTYSEQLTFDRSKMLFETFQNLSWIGYAFSPIILGLKFILVSIILYTGAFLFNLSDRISFSSVLKIVIASDGIFIVAGLLKILWFILFAGNYDLNDLGFFYPLSLANLFRVSDINKIWVSPLQIVNVFQIIYLLLLSFGLRNVCNVSRGDSEKIVLSSYLPSLVLWIVIVMFISIDLTT